MNKKFTFEAVVIDGKCSVRSTAEGVTAFEIIGFLEWKKNDIFSQIAGNIKPDVVTRTRFTEDKTENETP